MSPRYEAVVIGASAGALDALNTILPELPANYPLPVFVVVHLPPDKKSILAQLLKNKCRVDVREAEDKEPVEGGVIYIAAPDYHMLIEESRTLALSSDEPVLYSRPSIDVLFESAADVYGEALIGVILTGASSDGAHGLKTVLREGGVGLVQQPAGAYASAMPQAAIAACPGAQVLSLHAIAETLREAGKQCP